MLLCYIGNEALSVVSEDPSIFDSSYGSSHLMKTDMTSEGDFSQGSKESPEAVEQDWLHQGGRATIKRENEHVNGSRRKQKEMDVPKQLVKFTSDGLAIDEEVAKYLSTLTGVAEVISIVGIVDLARSYVRMLNNNESVCLREAAKDMTETQLNHAFREAWDEFQSCVQTAIIDQLPMETELEEIHSQAQQCAMKTYEKYTSFFIDMQKTLDKKSELLVLIENNREVLLKKNYEKSELKCRKEFYMLKNKHIGPVMDYTGKKAFEKMGRQVNQLIEEYEQLSGMGPAKENTFSKLCETELVDLLTFSFQATIRFIEQQYAERKAKIQVFVGDLKKTADIMDKLQMNSTIANVAGSSAAVAGSVLTITGLALLPFTFGASAVLTGVGVGVGVAGGVTTVTADICRSVKNKNFNNDVKETHEKIMQDLNYIAELLRYVCDQLSQQKEAGDSNWVDHVFRLFALGNFVGVLDDILGVGIRVAANVARVAGIVVAALAMVLDVYAIIKKSIQIHKGCKTERAKEIRDLAQSIEEELTNVEDFIAQMKKQKKDIR
ncbi:UNVERIFIED_CONTAM: hypothetical protein FKN15_067396 [Acipenser sinensis]